MKKHLLIGALMALGLASASAQSYHFGVQLSPSISWMSTNSNKVNGVNPALGTKLGAVVEKRFSDSYALTSGIGFHFNNSGSLRFDVAGKHWTESYDNFDPRPAATDTFAKETKLRYSLTYLEIPIGLRMRTPERGNHMRFFVEPNLALGILTKSRGAVSNAGAIVAQEQIAINKEVSPFNLSWGIGAGTEYTVVNNTSLVVGLFFQQGFVDVTRDNGVLYDGSSSAGRKENSKAILSNLSVRLGVLF